MNDDRGGSLLAWQWSRYPAGHRDRRNLMVHAVTVPVFQVGTIGVLMGPFVSAWLALVGLAAMGGVMVLQGRTHRLEHNPPAPFRGPGDVVARFFAEQWITFPRYVASGAFGEAWSAAGSRQSQP